MISIKTSNCISETAGSLVFTNTDRLKRPTGSSWKLGSKVTVRLVVSSELTIELLSSAVVHPHDVDRLENSNGVLP